MAWRQVGCLGQHCEHAGGTTSSNLPLYSHVVLGFMRCASRIGSMTSCQFTQFLALNTSFQFLAERRGIADSLFDDFVQITSRPRE